MNLLKVVVIALLLVIPFSGAAAREKLVVGQPAPSCLAPASEESPSFVMAVFLRGLF